MTRARQSEAKSKEQAAEDAVAAISPDDSDQTIAEIVAEYLLTRRQPPLCHLGIIHDVRPSTLRKVNSIRRKWHPDYEPPHPFGPCPVPYDWHVANTVGITTHDRDRARQWIIAAMLAGYSVFRRYRRDGAGFGKGSIADMRERAAVSTPRLAAAAAMPPRC